VIKVLGLSLYGELAASHRYRLKQYTSVLLDYGIELEIFSLLNDDYLKRRFDGKRVSVGNIISSAISRLQVIANQDEYDCAIVHCELFPLMPSLLESKILKIPYIYDFDDAWYLRYKQGRLSYFSFFLGNKIDVFIKNAAAVTAGNSFLASYALNYNKNVTILPTVVDTNYYVDYSEKYSNNDTFTIGWIGSVSTCQYLTELILPLEKLGLILNVRLVIVGGSAPDISNIEIVEIPWSIDTEVSIIKDFDVGVMPLFDDEWSRGKCAFKLIQYMACGVPVVASRVGENIQLVSEECGFLVSNDTEWLNALLSLCKDSDKRTLMGKASRERIVEKYSLQAHASTLSSIIKKVAKCEKNNTLTILESKASNNLPISVIIPCYNCHKTIKRSIKSILRQTKKPSEVIIIDDCSNNKTRELLHKLQEEYKELQIKIIELEKNLGVASARNAGINASKYKYLAFLDADDIWLFDKIEKQYDWMVQNPNVLMTGCVYALNNDKNFYGGYIKGELRTVKVGKIAQLISNRFSTSSVMCKNKPEIIFQHGKRHSEDYLLWLELIFDKNLVFQIKNTLSYHSKPPYGSGGLSGDLLAMEKGELHTYKQLFIQGRIYMPAYAILHIYSYVKYIRRIILCLVRYK
jgi:glycosyltransferase involved in cell wall biosynthesis